MNYELSIMSFVRSSINFKVKYVYQKLSRIYRVRFLRDVCDIRETRADYYVHRHKWVLNEFFCGASFANFTLDRKGIKKSFVP